MEGTKKRELTSDCEEIGMEAMEMELDCAERRCCH